MEYLHTMIRIRNIEESLKILLRWPRPCGNTAHESEKGRFTLIFLAAPGDVEHAKAHRSKEVELTFQLG